MALTQETKQTNENNSSFKKGADKAEQENKKEQEEILDKMASHEPANDQEMLGKAEIKEVDITR